MRLPISKFTDVPTIALDLGSAGKPQPAPTKPVRSPGRRAFARGRCPGCGQVRGLVQDGPHLVWLSHDHRTIGGVIWPCSASLRPCCQKPPKPDAGRAPIACTCGGER